MGPGTRFSCTGSVPVPVKKHDEPGKNLLSDLYLVNIHKLIDNLL